MKDMGEIGRLVGMNQQYPGKTDAPAASPSPAAAPEMSKASAVEAGYQGPDQGPFACGDCQHFDGKSACELVDGQIESAGCCNLFSKEA